MSLLTEVGPYLPYVRRYARALTGSQESGDAYVRAALEALASGEATLDRASPAKRALYTLFHRIWSTTAPAYDPSRDDDGLDGGRDAQSRLLRITPINRQALLLTAMEGFSPEETALIIGTTTIEVRAMIESAQREIEADLATSVLIIEDEPVIAVDLEALMRGLGHRVTAIARTRAEAVAAARAEQPGLILADIQLKDGSSGIDAVRDILHHGSAPVIFITAFPERLLTGERPEPAFLITKPFLPETVKAAVGQALFFQSRARSERPVISR
jgi:CheY-like chemotaxis protein